jgi:hypothetical protein
MDTAARGMRTVTSRMGSLGRLLAVRKAGAAFDGCFALRSPRFEALLEERSALRGELAAASTALLDMLHDAVPRAQDREHRRLLLRLKRDVFNERTPAWKDGLGKELSAALARYAALQERLNSLFADGLTEILTEQRLAITALLEDKRFRQALRYSSPDLWEALATPPTAPAEDYSALERGVYAYAARFISKANPLHLFAEILFPSTTGIEVDSDHEMVLDVATILDLERRILPEMDDPERVWLSLRPFVVRDGKVRFCIPLERGFRMLSLRESEALRAIIRFFAHQRCATGRPTGTRANCEARLFAELGAEEAPRALSLLAALVEKGVMSEYLVTGLDAFAPALTGPDEETTILVEGLQRLHLARMDTSALIQSESALVEFETARATKSQSGKPWYYVNSYARADMAPHRAAAELLFDDLHTLKPFYSVANSFTPNAAVTKAFVLEYLGGAGQVPLLDVLGPFVRDLGTLIKRFHADTSSTQEERARRDAWSAACAAQSGRLDQRQLNELLPDPAPPARHLCFNGPFDYVDNVLYLSNVWAGGGRYISRYLLRRRTARSAERPYAPECLDVELAVPPRTNLDYVVRTYATGCGFDARYSHQFEHWIDPAEILLEAADGQVRYRHEPTGAQLRIHYRGFNLAGYLPAEYQILLTDHADTPRDPFRGDDDLAGVDQFRHVPALHFGAVCLRRERWLAAAVALAPLLADADPLQRAARFRDWVHERLHPGAELWYYRTSNTETKGYKPQLLDLRNPLGVTAFRRAVAAVPRNGVVALSPMHPVPAHLCQFEGAPYVTELMVEV